MRRIFRALVSLLFLFSALSAPARPPSGPASREPQAPSSVASATRVDRAPKLDGTLDDPLWQSAAPVTDFRQREPYEGQPPTERTEVRILYTHKEVFFGVTCFDSQPHRIIATQLRRDASQELDDYFAIVIDSNRNRRNAYLFQINPLGTQRDGLITDEQESQSSGDGDGDPAWDGIWTSEARRTSSGWTATIAIPFATLNFLHSGDVAWGINFKRFIRRKNEQDLWSAWRRNFGLQKISQAGSLEGISEIGSGRLLVIKPFGLLGFEHLAPAAAAAGLRPGTHALYTGGLDVKVGLHSNIVANLTANTDFADADVDTQQFNLTPYRLFFPEKRQFFLENAGIFNFPIGGENDRLFFSRQIGVDPLTGQQVPVNGGAKLTGSYDGFDFGFMDVSTRSVGPNPYANFAVARVKRSLFHGSYIGFMGIDKQSSFPSLSYNQTGGVDARLVLPLNFIATAFAAQSRSPGFSGGQSDFGGSLSYRSNWLDLLAERRKIGPNFNPQVGFIERSDCVCDWLDGSVHLRPHFRGLREINLESFLFHAPDTHGVLQTQEFQATIRVLLHNGAQTDDDLIDTWIQRITVPFNLYKNVTIPLGYYRWDRHQISAASPQDRRFIVRVTERFGGYYNGRMNELRVRLSYRPNERLMFSFINQWNRFRLPVAGGNFSVYLAGFETDYAFNRFLSLSAILQPNTANTQALSANVRLRWNYRPDSDFYVVYTAGQQFANLAEINPTQLMEHRLSLKFTYSFLR